MKLLKDLIRRYPELKDCEPEIDKSFQTLVKCFSNSNRLYIIGNGGSAADALHIVGELTKSFVLNRKLDSEFVNKSDDVELISNLQGAFPAFALVENSALTTAYANDCSADFVFAQQVYAYTRKNDCVLGISTSGNSKNIVYAIETAKIRGAYTIAMTGLSGGRLKDICDICICVPETETYKIQEFHLPIYHTICLMLESYFWGEGGLWNQ